MNRTLITTCVLALAGLGMSWSAGGRLQDAFSHNPNPLGLKRSPYGQVIAMAIQAPIDADWHGGIEVHDMPATADNDHDAHAGHDHNAHGCTDPTHDHGDHEEPACPDPDCTHDHGGAAPSHDLLTELSRAVKKRTNPHAPSEAHKFFLRRQIEKKMLFAYHLDPSHYANYNSYNLFLTEPEIGTRRLSQEEVFRNVSALARTTINYCLREQYDPRPSLTAAAAATNVLQQMFLNPGDHSFTEMRRELAVLDFCLKRYSDLVNGPDADDFFARLSPLRQNEILERAHFVSKVREACEKTIIRLENHSGAVTASHD